MASDTIILGIDAAIAGGSVSLILNDEQVASWTGSRNISKAEELLPSIDQVLSTCSRKVSQLTGIVIYIGPGSFTGIKVGISTALGLGTASKVTLKGISAFEAIRFSSNHDEVIVAIPVGRGHLALQQFRFDHHKSPPELKSIIEFANELNNVTVPLLVHSTLIDELNVANNSFVENIGENMATYAARAFNTPYASERIEPLYLDRNCAK
jgi:tRNA threonylcarbamoyl adenosine modification protein YeaZ